MGYKFQFITLAGFHALNYSMFELARGYARENMTAYVRLQQAEFAAEGLNTNRLRRFHPPAHRIGGQAFLCDNFGPSHRDENQGEP